MSKLLRGGRLDSIREDVAKFTSSMKDDIRFAEAVIDINKAHVIMLMEQKIINRSDGAKILKALNKISKKDLDASAEDVHMAVEELVLKIADEEIGANLHIAKSRNDQVTTAIRIELRKNLLELMAKAIKTQESLLETAKKHLNTVILEYTHLQPAQPVTFAHYLLSQIDSLERNLQRLLEAYSRTNLCPLGAGALATTSFPINREKTAELLGFDGLAENSIDAVGSRDYIIEAMAVLTLISIDLSRLSEDLIVWSTPDFGIIELPDGFASTSSIMPQKKNPEPLEVIRATASAIIGNFVTSAATLKGLPSTYNLDFQEITPILWDSIDKVSNSLEIIANIIPNLKVTPDISKKALASFVAATEIANMIVQKYNVPFRAAHKIVGFLVKLLIESKLTFEDVTPELLHKTIQNTYAGKLDVKPEDITDCIDPNKIVQSHQVKGGPAPKEVQRALENRKKHLIQNKKEVSQIEKKLDDAKKKLETAVKTFSHSNFHQT